jgi:hypothetical protein
MNRLMKNILRIIFNLIVKSIKHDHLEALESEGYKIGIML